MQGLAFQNVFVDGKNLFLGSSKDRMGIIKNQEESGDKKETCETNAYYETSCLVPLAAGQASRTWCSF